MLRGRGSGKWVERAGQARQGSGRRAERVLGEDGGESGEEASKIGRILAGWHTEGWAVTGRQGGTCQGLPGSIGIVRGLDRIDQGCLQLLGQVRVLGAGNAGSVCYVWWISWFGNFWGTWVEVVGGGVCVANGDVHDQTSC